MHKICDGFQARKGNNSLVITFLHQDFKFVCFLAYLINNAKNFRLGVNIAYILIESNILEKHEVWNHEMMPEVKSDIPQEKITIFNF